VSENRGSYLGECYWPGVNEQKLDHAAERMRTAADELPGQRHDLRFGGSILLPAGQAIVWLFDGDEADMRALSEQASVASERVLRSLRIGGSEVRPQRSASGSCCDTQ
jgi:hypothetical protein